MVLAESVGGRFSRQATSASQHGTSPYVPSPKSKENGSSSARLQCLRMPGGLGGGRGGDGGDGGGTGGGGGDGQLWRQIHRSLPYCWAKGSWRERCSRHGDRPSQQGAKPQWPALTSCAYVSPPSGAQTLAWVRGMLCQRPVAAPGRRDSHDSVRNEVSQSEKTTLFALPELRNYPAANPNPTPAPPKIDHCCARRVIPDSRGLLAW